jgi:hypothetical protein
MITESDAILAGHYCKYIYKNKLLAPKGVSA